MLVHFTEVAYTGKHFCVALTWTQSYRQHFLDRTGKGKSWQDSKIKPISPVVWECYRTSGCIFQRRGRHKAKTLTLLPCLVLLLLLVFSGGSPHLTIPLSSTKMISSLPSLSEQIRQNLLCEIWCFAKTFNYLSLLLFLHVSQSQAATCRSMVNYCQCFCFEFLTRHMRSQWVEVTIVTTIELMKN